MGRHQVVSDVDTALNDKLAELRFRFWEVWRIYLAAMNANTRCMLLEQHYTEYVLPLLLRTNQELYWEECDSPEELARSYYLATQRRDQELQNLGIRRLGE